MFNCTNIDLYLSNRTKVNGNLSVGQFPSLHLPLFMLKKLRNQPNKNSLLVYGIKLQQLYIRGKKNQGKKFVLSSEKQSDR